MLKEIEKMLESSDRYVINCPSMTGKMTSMVRWAKVDPNRKILVIDQTRKQDLLRNYGLTESQVFTIEEYKAITRVATDIKIMGSD